MYYVQILISFITQNKKKKYTFYGYYVYHAILTSVWH